MNKLLVVSSYPQQGTTHGQGTVGVASYTKLLLESMRQLAPDLEITILAEILDKPIRYAENHIVVDRIWRRNSFISLITLFRSLYQSSSSKLFISFEAFMFGSPIYSGLALVFLCMLKLTGKDITLAMHQVMGDFKEIEPNPTKALILNANRSIFYWLISISVNKIVVFEEQLKKQLNKKQAMVIPHFVANSPKIPREKARQLLGWNLNSSYVLYFGFIAPYKGIDELVTIWPAMKDTELVIAGGINPNYLKNTKMTSFVKHVMTTAKQKHIPVTGYIDEKDIPLYFCAADIIIFPYRTFLGSSGPLALAFDYEKPVLLSQALINYKKTNDFSSSLKETKLKIDSIVFTMNSDELKQKILKIQRNKNRLLEFAKAMKTKRSIQKIAKMYLDTISL